jgi:hypothetical protein
MWQCGAAFSTSPRLRGEVGAKRRVRGRLRKLRLVERPPHPDPLPASGERESQARCLPDDHMRLPCGIGKARYRAGSVRIAVFARAITSCGVW